MKRILCLCFMVGLAAGFRVPGMYRVARDERKNGISIPSEVAASRGDLEALPSIRQIKDRVEISQDRLRELLKTATSSAVSVDSFYNGMQPCGWQTADPLAEWARLDAGEKSVLTRILLDAAKARMAWEKANVQVESSGPGKWMLRFPGDQGKARDDLRRQIESDFPPEQATAIWLAGDLDNFFGLGVIWPEFKNGQLEVVAHAKGKILSDPVHGTLFFSIPTNDRDFLFEIASSDLENNPFFGRLLGLLGTPEEIRKSAAEAEIDGPVSK